MAIMVTEAMAVEVIATQTVSINPLHGQKAAVVGAANVKASRQSAVAMVARMMAMDAAIVAGIGMAAEATVAAVMAGAMVASSLSPVLLRNPNPKHNRSHPYGRAVTDAVRNVAKTAVRMTGAMVVANRQAVAMQPLHHSPCRAPDVAMVVAMAAVDAVAEMAVVADVVIGSHQVAAIQRLSSSLPISHRHRVMIRRHRLRRGQTARRLQRARCQTGSLIDRLSLRTNAMKHFLIAALFVSTAFGSSAYAAQVSEEGPRAQADTAQPTRDDSRRGWRGNRGGGNGGGEWRRSEDRGGGAWQPRPEQPQPQPLPQGREWRGQSGTPPQPQGDWRNDRRDRDGDDRRGGWGRRDDRRNDRGNNNGWQQPTPPVTTPPAPQPEWRGNRGNDNGGRGDEWRGDERRRDDRWNRGSDWGDRGQNDGSGSARDNRYDNGWDRDRGGWRDDDRRNGNGWDRNNGGWNNDDNHRRGDERRHDRWDRDDRRWDRDDRRHDNDRWNRHGEYGRDAYRWNNGWRNDRRYDWRGHRDRYGDYYRPGRYYAPGRHNSYSRFSIGFSIGAHWYGDQYWIADPWYYRLPPVYGPYRWIRYYNDVLLIDTRNGYVADVIHDFFW
jgi:hypothetical protein